ncbi:hypothetical protein F0726_00094 [Acidithiobacillus caldus]|nr:hypothetical protein F0726_00094 [Acidithiobacillus caldus]
MLRATLTGMGCDGVTVIQHFPFHLVKRNDLSLIRFHGCFAVFNDHRASRAVD